MTGPKRVTEKQIAARRASGGNRTNAQLSTGPRTPEGKAVSRWNALTHGILVQAIIPPLYEAIKFSRYEITFERQIYRVLNALECLQRRGHQEP